MNFFRPIHVAFFVTLMSASALAKIQKGSVVFVGDLNSNAVGVVEQVFGNKAEVKFFISHGGAYSGPNEIRPCDTLSEMVDSKDGLVSGTKVYGNNGIDLIGQVSRIFANGVVEVLWTSASYPVDLSRFYYWTIDLLTPASNSCDSCE